MLLDVLNLQMFPFRVIANAKLEQPDVSSHSTAQVSAEGLLVLVVLVVEVDDVVLVLVEVVVVAHASSFK